MKHTADEWRKLCKDKSGKTLLRTVPYQTAARGSGSRGSTRPWYARTTTCCALGSRCSLDSHSARVQICCSQFLEYHRQKEWI